MPRPWRPWRRTWSRSTPDAGPVRSADLAAPAERVVATAVLDVEEPVADGHRRRALLLSDEEWVGPVQVEPADRRQHRRRTARERLDDLAGPQAFHELVERDRTDLSAEPQLGSQRE